MTPLTRAQSNSSDFQNHIAFCRYLWISEAVDLTSQEENKEQAVNEMMKRGKGAAGTHVGSVCLNPLSVVVQIWVT
jgi:hypothetical protein